jgi:zinc transport system substrate-binding protein
MKFSRLISSLLAVSALVLAACGGESSSSNSSTPAGDVLTIATSFYPLSEIVEKVTTGMSVEIVNLTPPGVGAHDHELTASQLDDLTTVDAVFYLGGGLQPSVEKAVAQLDNTITVVDLMDHAQTIDAVKEKDKDGHDDHSEEEGAHSDEEGHDDHSEEEGAHSDEEGHDDHSEEEGAHSDEEGHDDHAHGDTDPHVWLDPANMISMTKAVVATLSTLAPDSKTTLDTNSASYIAELEQLGTAIDTAFANCASRALVTSHDAFGYFAARAKLDTVPIAGVNPENEPSAKELEAIAQVARDAKATTVFFEAQLPEGLAKTVASAIGAQVDLVDPIETISSADLNAGKNYISIQTQNIENVTKGLRCS